MELINQPFSGRLGDRLIQLLESGDFHTLNIAVAFAKNSGVLRVKDALAKFRASGGKVKVYVGVDLGGTSYEALTALLLYSDSLSVVHSEKSQTFHPKIYQFVGATKGLLVVGSHNLTGGGLWTNFESSTLTPLDGSSVSGKAIHSGVEEFFVSLERLGKSIMPIRTQEDVELLFSNGYVIKEVTEQVQHSRAAAKEKGHKRLFGVGVTARLPHLSHPPVRSPPTSSVAPAASIAVSDDVVGETIWFESRSMTGGSRNILDLSMRSRVTRGDPSGTKFDTGDPGFMRGAVEFFGVDPQETSLSKNIKINFQGVDYSANKILFPSGRGANGTWRLQIKGVSSSGIPITDALRASGERFYLVQKIIAFNKIDTDYFSMSVFPKDQLRSFEEASYILARNGETNSARRLGIIRSD